MVSNCSLCLELYTEFIMADGSGKPRYEYLKTRRVRIRAEKNAEESVV